MHIYIKNEKERKGDITDSILSQKQHMTRTGIEHYVNKRRGRNVCERNVLQSRREER